MNSTLFTFSDLTFPSAPASTLKPSHTAFDTFVSTLKKRTSHRTPLLDAVLIVMEDAAAGLKADMHILPSSLVAQYRDRVKSALDTLVNVLKKVLELVGPGRGDGKFSIEAEMFVGRVALYLAKSSTFLRDVVAETEVDISWFERNLGFLGDPDVRSCRCGCASAGSRGLHYSMAATVSRRRDQWIGSAL